LLVLLLLLLSRQRLQLLMSTIEVPSYTAELKLLFLPRLALRDLRGTFAS
jgi:hypothetical protein